MTEEPTPPTFGYVAPHQRTASSPPQEPTPPTMIEMNIHRSAAAEARAVAAEEKVAALEAELTTLREQIHFKCLGCGVEEDE